MHKTINFGKLENVTAEITSSMEEMSDGAKKINKTEAFLNDISSQINNSISEIGDQIDLFKV